MLSNESFSGKGHRQHVCSKCRRLGSEELSRLQTFRNLESCSDWEGTISRRKRKYFETFLNHPDSEVRLLAQAMRQDDLENRALFAAEAVGNHELIEEMLSWWKSRESCLFEITGNIGNTDSMVDEELIRQFGEELYWEEYHERNSQDTQYH